MPFIKAALHRLLCAVFLLGLPFAPLQAQTQTDGLREGIVVVMPEDFPPYVTRGADGVAEGIRVDTWRLWSERTGIPVTFLFKPWRNTIAALERGEADVVDLLTPSTERADIVDFSPPYDTLETAIYYRRDIVGVVNSDTLQGLATGVVRGGTCESHLATKSVTTTAFASLQDLIYDAVLDQLPVFCVPTAPADFLLGKAGVTELYRKTPSIFGLTVHWAVARGNEALYQQIAEGFTFLSAEDLARIEKRWEGQDPPGILGISPDHILRLLEVLAAVVLAAVSASLILRWRLGRALEARDAVEDALRQRIREQTCLHGVFLATDDMQRPFGEILSDVAKALKSGFQRPDDTKVRISLLGESLDEIADADAAVDADLAISVPILIEGKERGRLTVLPGDRDRTPDSALSQHERLLLELAASRIAGRAIGATALTQLRISEERFRRTFQHSAQATAVLRNGVFVEANPASLAMLGYENADSFIGRSPDDISPPRQPDGEPSAQKARRLINDVLEKGNTKFEWEHLRTNGEPILLEVLLTAVTEDNHTDIFVIWNDITVKRQAEQALAAYQQTLEAQVAQRTEQLSDLNEELSAILRTADSGIELVRDRKIITCNPSLGRLLLWPVEELIGQSTRVLYKDDESWTDGADDAYARLFAGETYETTEELIRRDGTPIWVRMRASAIDVTDPSRGTVWVIDDISNERAAAQQLAEARDIAEQAARLKSEFLAHMSHELRSPINAVLGFTEILLGSEMTAHQTDYLQKVQASGRHLLMIINDILDLSKVEAGKLRIEQTEFALSTVVKNAVDTIAAGAATKDLEVLVEVDADVPPRLMGDPLRLTQILMNYLSNALKFTETGEIRLHVALDTAETATAARVRFSVTDTGIGMSAEQIARMFQSFSQAEDSTARLYGGTGLGLAICRQLASLMQGEVGVDSRQGRGSTFWVSLPLVAAPSRARRPRMEQLIKDRRILVVEDNHHAARVIAQLLTAAGAIVETRTSGPEGIAAFALAKSQDAPYDAVVVDRKMPVMDGISFVRHLRAAHGPTLPPIVLMTKTGGQQLMDLAMAEGVSEILIKPVERDILIEKLARIFRKGHDAVAGPQARPISAQPDRGAATDAQPFAGRRALVVDDHPLNRELAAAMLTRQGLTVETATNGAEAIQMLLDRPFDLILMDSEMPVMGGFEATRRIRALPTARGQVPIIGVTGRSDETDRSEGLAVGMNDYVEKPMSSARLREILGRWLPNSDHIDA